MTRTTKAKAQVIFLLTSVLLSIASAGQVDPRFDGRWVGVEIFPLASADAVWISKVPQVTTVIGIAQSGKMLGVVSGFLPGLYQISPKSGGNTLIFYGGRWREGRNDCKLKLSPDGKTFKESGWVVISVDAQLVSAQVYGTFHRVSK